MKASTLATRALRLINVPGRGADLSDEDLNGAVDTLSELLDNLAASRSFQPGIRRHFFNVTPGEHEYTYGPGGDLDTDLFDDDVPFEIEEAYIRAGSTILDHEKVAAHTFKTATGWTLGAGWSIVNDEARSSGIGALSQVLALTVGVDYDVALDVEVSSGSATFALDALAENVTTTGEYSFSFTATAAAPTLSFGAPGATPFEAVVNSISVRQRNIPQRVELVGTGSDYEVRVRDSRTYNAKFSKGQAGRPYNLLFSRGFPLGFINFDNAPGQGDVLILDVKASQIGITSSDSDIRMHPEAMRFLRYQLAEDLAPEYGKTLQPRQLATLRKAKQMLQAGNKRIRDARVDSALTHRRSFDINRGDP